MAGTTVLFLLRQPFFCPLAARRKQKAEAKVIEKQVVIHKHIVLCRALVNGRPRQISESYTGNRLGSRSRRLCFSRSSQT